MDIFISILVIFGILFFFWFLMRKRSEIKAEWAEEEITAMGEQVLVVTSSEVPIKKVKEVLGSVTGISKSASTEAGFTRAEREAMAAVMRRGLAIGANAILDLRMTTWSYEQQGTK